jgi:hypothetical protein
MVIALLFSVLWIWDVYPGSKVEKIPDPGSGSASKNFVFLPKKLFPSSQKNDLGCSSRIPDPGVKKHRIPDPDPDPQHCLFPSILM